MAKCPYCESKLILINTFNCEDVYNEEGYETHWYCENGGMKHEINWM